MPEYRSPFILFVSIRCIRCYSSAVAQTKRRLPHRTRLVTAFDDNRLKPERVTGAQILETMF
jgi:hypothetical protein